MENVSLLLQGFQHALSLNHIAIMAAGVMLGLLVGVLPGLGAANGVTLLIPLTLTMDPLSAIILLSSIYWGALFGGSTTSILFNIPGEPSSVATTFDGHPMARAGAATQALSYAFLSAGIGALVGVLLITLLSQYVADFAMKFSPPEFFAVFVLAFSSFVGLGSGSPLKTVAMIVLGLGFGQIGADTVSGVIRLTFGSDELMRGVSFLVAVIGLFGIGELLVTVEEGLKFEGVKTQVRPQVVLQTMASMPRYWLTLLRSTAIGCWMGITPGGPTAASFMSYGLAKRFSRKPERFGHGTPEGVIAPEAADHAAGSCAMLPTLALGIPGSATAAVMLGGLMMWGMTPGPMLFIDQPDFVWGFIASMYMANVVAIILVLSTVPLFTVILRVPFFILAPIILVICVVGAYTVTSARFDIVILMFFGLLGYLAKKLDYPLAPLILAMVIGDKAEDAFRQSMVMSQGSLSIFWSSSLGATTMALACCLFAWPLIGRAIGAVRKGAS